MLTTINKRNPEYNARDWPGTVGTILIPLTAILNALRKRRGESKPQRALWKQFDDTHHWDLTAEEWVRNDGQ